MEIPKSFLGFKRENGRAGTRNHVIILPVDDISNACAEAVANNIKGTIALPHSYTSCVRELADSSRYNTFIYTDLLVMGLATTL